MTTSDQYENGHKCGSCGRDISNVVTDECPSCGGRLLFAAEGNTPDREVGIGGNDDD